MKTDLKNTSSDHRGGRPSRQRRTQSTFACESLEGRKLMTGFAGATGAMLSPGGPAEMGGMTVSSHDSQANSMRSEGVRPGGGADATDSPQMAQTASSTLMSDGATGYDFAPHRNDFGADGGDLANPRGEMVPGSQGGGMTGGNGQGDLPVRGRTGPEGQGETSTGNLPLDADLAKLRSDEQAIRDKSEVTPKLLAAVRNDLQAISKAQTGSADATALQTLQTDEETIFASQTAPTDAQTAQLQADRDAVLLSQGVSQDLIDQLAADRLAVKTASHFTADDQALLDADRKAIETDRSAAQPTSTPTDATPTDATATATATETTAPTVTDALPTNLDSAMNQPAHSSATTPIAPSMNLAPPTAVDPAMNQTAQPAVTAAVVRPARPSNMTHRGRPAADEAGGLSQHGPMSFGGASQTRRARHNAG